ncbi:DUF5753 domain-containing protein [Actinosynnema sp. NPDC020468]|uniref:DUF5753 domain-containing protein n=1 Tax=Actinosynnema sp. NPDC020468 TaxID=3154488 RepID=UPI0033FE80DB
MTERMDSYDARLEFGKLARTLRVAAGLEPGAAEAELIAAVGGYASVLSKLETSRMAPKPGHVSWMLARYAPSKADADRLVALADAASQRAQPVAGGVHTREYLARLKRATHLWMIYNEIPGSLQTYEFAAATLAKSPLVSSAEDVDALARDRSKRGERLFASTGPQARIVLGEAALDRMDGGPDVASRELERLLAASRLPNVHLRIVPSSAGSVTGLSNPFTLLHTEPDEWLAYVGHFARNEYVKKDVGRFRLVFDHAWGTAAASEVQTRAILEARIADLTQR